MNKKTDYTNELNVLNGGNFIKAKWNILNNPTKVTFNPLEAKMQDIYFQSIKVTSFFEFIKYNKDARYFIYFILYLIFAIGCLMFIYLIDATTL